MLSFTVLLNGQLAEANNIATTLRVTQPAADGNPDIDPSTVGVYETYNDPTIYLFPISGTEIQGRVLQNDGDGYDIAFKIKLVTTNPGDPSDLSAYKIVVEQYMAVDHGDDGNQFDTQLPLLINGDLFPGISIGLTLLSTITDGDGDTQTSNLAIVSLIDENDTFVHVDDDGPQVRSLFGDVSEGEFAALQLELDETIGEDRYNTAEAPQDNNGDGDDTAFDAPVLFTSLADPLADENFGELSTDLTGGLGDLFTTYTIDVGTDGASNENPSTELLTLTLNGVDEGAGLQTNLVATALEGTPLEGMSEADRTVWLFLDGGTIVGRVGQGTVSTADDFVVFTISVDDASDPDLAQLVVKQFLPIDHDLSEEPDAAEAPENPSLYDEQISLLAALDGQSVGLKLTVTVTDNDGDTTSKSAEVELISDDSSFVSFDDDGPSDDGVTFTASSIIHDETDGVQNAAADTDAPADTVVEHDELVVPGIFSDAFNTGGLFDNEGLAVGDAIGFALNEQAVTLDGPNSAFGSDGEHPVNPVALSFVLSGGGAIPDGTATSLFDTATGNRIFLYTEDGLLIGRVGTGTAVTAASATGDISFALGIEITGSDGAVSLAQFLAIEHGNPADNDESTSLSLLDANADPLGQLFIKAVVTDGDNDIATLISDNGLAVVFEDDGLVVTASGSVTLELDESIVDEPPPPTPPEGGTIPPGADDTLLTQPNGTQPFGVTTADVSGLFTIDAGADGEKSKVYTLIMKTEREGVGEVTEVSTTSFFATQPAPGGNPDSNTGDGNPFTPYADAAIYLFQIDAQTIEGHVGPPDINGDPTGPLALRMTIDPVTGVVTLEQYLAIHHSDANDHDFAAVEQSSPLEGVLAKLTVTDGDDDVASAEVPVSVRIEDDGPSVAFPSVSYNDLTVDESVGIGSGDPNANDEATVDLPSALDTYTANNSLNLIGAAVSVANPSQLVEFGSDGGTISRAFSLGIGQNADPIADGTPTGLNMSVGPGFPVFLFNQDGLIVGRAGSNADNAENGTIVFAIHIDPTTGTVSMAQYRPLEHDDPNDHDESLTPEFFDLRVEMVVTATDGDGDTDVATRTQDIRFNFEDDGPDVEIADAPNSVNENQTISGTWTLDGGSDGVPSVEVTIGGITKAMSIGGGGTETVTIGAGDGFGLGTLIVRENLTWEFTANSVASDQQFTFSINATDRDDDFGFRLADDHDRQHRQYAHDLRLRHRHGRGGTRPAGRRRGLHLGPA